MAFSLRKLLEEATAQVSPFDKGKTAATVRAARNTPPPAQTVSQPRPSLVGRNDNAPGFQITNNSLTRGLSRSFDQLNPIDNNRTYKQRTPTDTQRGISQFRQHVAQPIANSTVVPAKNMVENTLVKQPYGYYQGFKQAFGTGQRGSFVDKLARVDPLARRNIQDYGASGDILNDVVAPGIDTGINVLSAGTGSFGAKQFFKEAGEQGFKTATRNQVPVLVKQAGLNSAQGADQELYQDNPTIKGAAQKAALNTLVGTAADTAGGAAIYGAGRALTNAAPKVAKATTKLVQQADEATFTPVSTQRITPEDRQVLEAVIDSERLGDSALNITSGDRRVLINNLRNVAAKHNIPIYDGSSKPLSQKLEEFLVARNSQTGSIKIPGRPEVPRVDPLPEDQFFQNYKPKGFVLKETPVRGGRKDTVRIVPGEKGLGRTLQSEPATLADSQLRVMGKTDVTERLQNPNAKLPETPTVRSIKEKSANADFMDTTNRFLGQKEASRTRNVTTVRGLPKLSDNESLSLIDRIQSGDNKAVPPQLRPIYDSKLQEMQNLGIDIGRVEDYFPQKWQNEDQVIKDYAVLNQRARIQNPRQIPTYAEGIKLGFKPLNTDYRRATQDYLNTADNLIANRRYFNELKSKGLIAEAGTRPQGMQAIDAPGLPEPRPFVDPETGNQIQGRYYADPSVAKRLNRLFGDQSPDGAIEKVLDRTAKIASGMQDIGLSGGLPGTPINAFTLAQGTKEVLGGNFTSSFKAGWNSLSQKKANKYFEAKAPVIQEMQSQGIPVRSGYRVDPKTFKDTGFRGLWQRAMNDPTFERFMPMLQTEMYEKVRAKHGAEVAAKAVKQFYGLTSMADEATRSKVGNNLVTTVFFAPKYRESMTRFWVDSAKSLKNPLAPGNRKNATFLVGAALSAVALDYVNQIGTGAHMWENPEGKKDKALLPGPGGKAVGIPFLSSIATVPRNVAMGGYNLATGNLEEAGKNAKSFLGFGVRPMFDLLSNEDYFGSRIVNPKDSAPERLAQSGAYLAKAYNHPYVREGMNAAAGKLPDSMKKLLGVRDQSGVETASKATELPLRWYDPSYFKGQGPNFNMANAGLNVKEAPRKTGSGKSDSADFDPVKTAMNSPEAQEFLKLSASEQRAQAETSPGARALYEQKKKIERLDNAGDLLPEDISIESSKILKQVERLTEKGKEKLFARDNNAEFNYEAAKFEKDKLEGKLTRVEEIKRKAALEKFSIAKDYDKDVREIASLSKRKVWDLITTDPNGKDIANKLIEYNDKLLDAEIITDHPYRDKYGNIDFEPSSAKANRGKKSKFDYSLDAFGTSRSKSNKSLRQLLKQATLSHKKSAI